MIYRLPIPKSSELFECIVCDLLNSLHSTTSFNLYGRMGQRQHGIDIISYEKAIVCQCKLRVMDINVRRNKIDFINDVIKDINSILSLNIAFEKIIIATTVENDTTIQDYINTTAISHGIMTPIELWSWDYISNNLFLFNNIVNKYFPFRNNHIEFASIKVLNKSIYRVSKENKRLFEFKNIKNRNQLPVFDISFINNTENTILLNSIDIPCKLLSVAKGGAYEKPSGILKVTKKITTDLHFTSEFVDNEHKNSIELKDPIYIYPKSPFRIQIQGKKPITVYMKIQFVFNFNQASIITPELFFNSDYAVSGRIVRSI